MLQESIRIIIKNFIQFNGHGIYFIVFIAALIYLWFKEKDKTKRAFIIYYNLFVLVITFNPLFHMAVKKAFESGVYWRVFWLFSMGITIAYAGVKLLDEGKEKVQKIAIFVTMFVVIAISGKLVYSKDNYKKMSNSYKLPDECIQVAQLIGVDEEEHKKAYVTEELSAYIRQVDPSIELAYKRAPDGYWDNEFVIAILEHNSEKIAGLAKKNNCNYIVLRKDLPLTLDMSYFDFHVLSMTDSFVIYKQN